MPHELFGSLINRPAGSRARSPLGLPISIAAHVVVLLVIVVIPLVATDTLPTPRSIITWVQPMAAPVPPAAPAPPVTRPAAVHPLEAGTPAVPVQAPTGIGQEFGVVPVREVTSESTPGALGTVPGGIDGGAFLAPPPAPEPARPVAPRPVGGQIRAPEKVRDVPPVYPPMAQAARVEGVVIIEAVIGTTGDVQNARVLKSVPLLDEAALTAVRQWKFTPTLLNGLPVPVIYTVTVRFALK
jgi:protein TonB